MKNFEFQSEAEKQITDKLFNVLKKAKPDTVLFSAPTGAGKTKMTANAIKSVYKKAMAQTIPVTFIWIAPRNLHVQSFDRIKAMFKGSKLRCHLLEDSSSSSFLDGSVTFFNWESINKESNVLVKDNEQESGLSQKIRVTRDKGIKIIAIIDEGHFGAKGLANSEVTKLINPDVVLDVTATPKQIIPLNHIIPKQDVIDAGLIRESIVVNPGLSSVTELTSSDVADDTIVNTGVILEISPESLMDRAIHWRNLLLAEFLKEDPSVSINPLILVQFPDSSKYGPDVNVLKGQILKHMQDVYGWSTDKEIAQWFDDVKLNLGSDSNGKLLIDLNNEVCVLFFKQAISLGWDCPRAHILVEFREFKSDTFKTQVLGRILRQPEQKAYHNSLLNKGYVFTNNAQIKLKKEVVSFFNFDTATLQIPEESVPLPVFFNKNLDERNFLREGVSRILETKLRARTSRITWSTQFLQDMIEDLEIDNIDEDQVSFNHLSVSGVIVGNSLGLLEDLWLKKQMGGLADSLQGRKYLREGWRNFFNAEFSDNISKLKTEMKGSSEAAIENALKASSRSTLLSNASEVYPAIRDSVVEHLINFEDPKKRQIVSEQSWSIPKVQAFNLGEGNKPVPDATFHKCAYDRVFGLNGIEHRFARWLDSQADVEWWIKNRDSGKDNFAIKYVDDRGIPSLFYVDFVVKFKDGKYGLFDPKGIGREGTGSSINTKLKADALFKFGDDNRCNVGIVGVKNNQMFMVSTGPYNIEDPLLKATLIG